MAILRSWAPSEALVEINVCDAPPLERAVLVLGNRRLSILDLSPAGHQPMATEDRSIWIAYNGEVYNYVELRSELSSAGYRFRTGTDTEVILNSYHYWGADCFRRFNGMWAMAIWDQGKRQLVLSRDHFGIKPLYYRLEPMRLLFASEIRALLLSEDRSPEPNLHAVHNFLAEKTSDTGTDTFFSGIKRVPAAGVLTFDVSDPSRILNPKSDIFWRIPDFQPGKFQPEDCRRRILELVEDAIRVRMRSDVPVGVCLSGGLDSSSLVVLLQKLLTRGKVNTQQVGGTLKSFSACYPDMRYDEKPYVEAILRHTAHDGYLTTPTGEDVRDVVQEVIRCQEEPFGSTGIISQWFVFRLARERGMKVMLDGQGADEVFAGYLTFFFPLFQQYYSQKRFARLLAEMIAAAWVHRYYRFWRVGGSRAVLGRFFEAKTDSLKKKGKAGSRSEPDWLVPDVFPGPAREVSPPGHGDGSYQPGLRKALADYLERYSLPSLLRFEDRNSMHFSIESRLPYLDPRLVEFGFSLPADYFLRWGVTKWILREAMRDDLPKKILKRRIKLGFATPEADWLRGPLRPMFEEIFESKSFAGRGFFDLTVVRREWKRFLAGGVADSSTFWRWGNLELWFREFID